jgi:hypothetical protein
MRPLRGNRWRLMGQTGCAAASVDRGELWNFPRRHGQSSKVPLSPPPTRSSTRLDRLSPRLFGQKRNFGSSVDFSLLSSPVIVVATFTGARWFFHNHRPGRAASAAIRTTACAGRWVRLAGLTPVTDLSFPRLWFVSGGTKASVAIDACPSLIRLRVRYCCATGDQKVRCLFEYSQAEIRNTFARII